MLSVSIKKSLIGFAAFVRKPQGMLVIALILFGCFLRLYRLNDTIHFQGDQGRDAILVKRMLTEGNLPFIGPVTSVGNLYLGPFYYYFMAPWLALTYPSPVGPVIGVALANCASLVLLYALTRRLFNQEAAVFSLALFAVMVPAITHSRFSWNPNIMPLFMLSIAYALSQSHNKPIYIALAWLLFGLIIQLHYMALVVGGVIAGFTLFLYVRHPQLRRQIMAWSLVGGLLFGLTLIPQIAFDLKNRGILSQGFLRFFTGEEIHISASTQRLSLATKLVDRLKFLLFELFRLPSPIASLVSLVLLFSAWVYALSKKMLSLQGFVMMLLALLTTWIGSYLYTSSVYEHYVAFFFPIAAIVWGVGVSVVYQTSLLGKALAAGIIVFISFVNIRQAHPFTAEAKPLSRFQRVVELTKPYQIQEKYNLAMIADDREYKALNYRYFFEVSENPPAHEDDYNNLEQLIVIAETKDIDPTTLSPIEFHPLHEMKLVQKIPQTNGPDILIYNRQ
jgi:4-amino-4-deoxy-L-arabinose transferase-like glycosyltransferase